MVSPGLEKRKINPLPEIEPRYFGRPFHNIFKVTGHLFQFLHRAYFLVLAVISLDVSPCGNAYENSVLCEKAYVNVKVLLCYCI